MLSKLKEIGEKETSLLIMLIMILRSHFILSLGVTHL